jgi:hypothetical protein
MDINSLISGVTEYARPNRYKVDIFPPNTMINGTTRNDKDSNYFEGLLTSFKDDLAGYVTGTQNGYGDQRDLSSKKNPTEITTNFMITILVVCIFTN